VRTKQFGEWSAVMAKTKVVDKNRFSRGSQEVHREYILPHGLKAIVFASGDVSIVEQDEQILYLHGGDVTIIEGKVKEVEVEPIGEEPEDEIFRQHNAFEKLIAEAKRTKPSPNWRAELDEL
jgi:hypothetical protein